MPSLLRYVGGKSRLARLIVDRIPPHRAYVEPFAGAAWVFFGKERSRIEVLNDRDGELINFWRVVQHHHAEFLRSCKMLPVSRQWFEWEKNRDPAGMTDIQRAARYYYLQRLAFGGAMKSPVYGTSSIRAPPFNPADLEKQLPRVVERLRRVSIECLDACECLRRYDNAETFFFIDPPYRGALKYTHNYNDDDFVRLANTLKSATGQFILTLNDDDFVRRTFADFHIERISCPYFISNTSIKRRRRQNGAQLLIHNLR